MEESIFPPSPSWFLPNIISTREDGAVAYGSKNNIVILKPKTWNNADVSIIRNAHNHKITAVAFSPSHCTESMQNTVASCSEDGYVKLWKIDTLLAIIGHKAHWDAKGEVGKIVSLDWSIANPHYIVSAAENNSLVLWDILLNSTIKFAFQKNLGTTVISCCPYNEKIVAVGGKTGQIHIISLTGSGDILYKLRGHDNKIHSLSWCPIPYNVFKQHEACEEFLLASACQNKEIFIWRAGTDGKCEAKFHIPTSPLSKKDNLCHGKVGNSFSYIALLWFEPYKIYSSSNFGELIYFDVSEYVSSKTANGASGKKSNKQSMSFVKLENCFHSKGLFAIAGSLLNKELVLYSCRERKSELKFTNQCSNCKVIEKPEDEFKSDFKWEVKLPETSTMLWTAGQDRKLVGCEWSSSKLKMVFNYQTMNGFVYYAAVSPHDPYKIAIAVGDGVIRLWNLTDIGDLQIFWQKIKDKVMALAWHPTRDGILAYGTSEGRIGMLDTNSNKMPIVFKPGNPNPIYILSWGPEFPSEDTNDVKLKSEFDLYSIGDNKLSLYSPSKISADPINLSKIIPFPCKKQTDVCWKPDYSLMAVGNEDGSICLVEPLCFKIVYTVMAYKKLIESIAWHPISTSVDSGVSPFHGYFTSGSTDSDCEIRVFNCKKETDEVKVVQVATLKGHHGHITSVAWSPHASGRLISTSADLSVQIWDVVSQTPLVNFTPSGMPIFSIWSPIDSDFILTGCRSDALHVWRVSAQSKTSPAPIVKPKKGKKDKSIQLSKESVTEVQNVEPPKENDNGIVEEAETKSTTKNSKELKMFLKGWRGSAQDELKICYDLLKHVEEKNDEKIYSLPFLNQEDDLKDFLKAEEETLKKSTTRTEYYELALWNGNIKELIEEKIKSGDLNDFLVSLAPTISPRLWQEACLSYSKTLSEKKLYRKAASYLLVCHKIYEAIDLLRNANLYLEALCIVRSRLPQSDPINKKIVSDYGHWLLKTGCLLKASQCFLYLNDYLEVSKIFEKKKEAEYLSLAALAAKKCGPELENVSAMNAIFKSLQTNNFELAQRICRDHENLTDLRLIYSVYETIHRLDTGQIKLEKDFLSFVKESCETKNVVFSYLPKFFHRYEFYNNKYQVFAIITQELSLAVCTEDIEEIITHLTKVLSTCYRYVENTVDDLHPLYKMCIWLSPEGFLAENSYFTIKNPNLCGKIKSMRAFLCAAIVRHLDSNQSTEEDVVKLMDILYELKEDLLDEDCYKHWKNLISVEICEKRLLTNRNKLSRRTMTSEKFSVANGEDSIQTIHPQETVENGYSNSETEIQVVNSNDEIALDAKTENFEDDVESKKINLKESEEETDLENHISNDLELLKRLKSEIENFEENRISSPNPIPVFSTLKKLCQEIAPKSEKVKKLLEELERKWQEIKCD